MISQSLFLVENVYPLGNLAYFMLRTIFDIMPLYSQFELVLPEELTDNVKSELEKARIKFNKIQTSDLASVKNLLDRIPNKKNKIIKFDKFKKDPHYVIKVPFNNRNEVAVKVPI